MSLNNNLASGFWEIIPGNPYATWDQITRDIFEVPETYQPLRKNVTAFFKDTEKLNKAFSLALIKGEKFDLEFQVVTAKGKPLKVRISGDAEFTDGDCSKVHGKVALAVDIWKNKKVLITDNDPLNVMIIKRYLKQWKVDSDVAESGFAACELVSQKDYGLVLMDLQMPVMDGYEATQIIRNMEGDKYKNLPIIAFTASTEWEIKEKMFDSGINGILNKPFEPAKLYTILSTYFIDNPTQYSPPAIPQFG